MLKWNERTSRGAEVELYSLYSIYAEQYIHDFLTEAFPMSTKPVTDAAAAIEPLTPAAVFKCLADETRARMTLLIARQGELCVCELTAALNESQPKISRHLSQLRSCAILADRRQGQWVYYRLHPRLPAWVSDMLRLVLNANGEWLHANAERLEQMRVRPGREPICG